MAVVIRFKRGQSTTWESKNLLLGPGEPGFELDTKQLKIGDGTTVWNELPYINDNERIEKIEEALENVYTKSDIDSKLTALFRYKGSKKSYDQLPEADENQTGDVWNIETADEANSVKAGDNVAWNGSEWDVLSGVFDLSSYVEKDGDKKLSTEDYTTADKEKLGGIEVGAQVNEVSSEEFSGLEERVDTLETNAEMLAKADGSNATGKWVSGANEADKLTNARTINGATFDGSENVNTQWAWNRSFSTSNNEGIYKILNAPTAITSAKQPTNYIISATKITQANNCFILAYESRNSPVVNCYGSLSDGVKVKYNNDGVYLELAEYVTVCITQIFGKNIEAFSQYAEMTKLESVPADLKDATVIPFQTMLNGMAGQVVGFDENGAAKTVEVGGTNLLTGTKDFSGAWTFLNDGTLNGTYNGLTIYEREGMQYGIRQTVKLSKGSYIFSAYAKVDGNNVKVRIGADSGYIDYYLNKSDGWVKFSYPFEIAEDTTETPYIQGYPSSGKYYVCGYKLERGSVATDWSPAPEDIQEIASGPKYGVSGVGGSSPTLTRLWDSVGLTAAVGTDTEQPTNDFDNLPPFNRRKCVGTWSEPDATGKAHFTVKAYYGDPDYTEDGTMGDYVAVEVEPFYYIQDMENGIWGVSPKYQPGWKIHPVCIDKKTQTVRAKTYLPCYRMAIEKNADTGKGVSLPDLYPVGNSYYQLKTWAHSYSDAAHLEPAEVRNYEELLFTIEFATTNSQNIMMGAVSMPMADAHVCAVASSGAVNYAITTAAIGDLFVVGQNIYFTTGSIWGLTGALAKDINKITKIEKCDTSGTVSDTGTHRKITFDGTARTLTTTTKIVTRPYTTGACNNVKTPSGSPVSNTDGKHPMRYRWREDIWGDIYSTSNDLFDHLNEQTIEYYYLTEPTWMPSAATKPAFEDFQKDPFVKLEQKCTNTNSFIVKMQGDSVYPYCLVPTNITGGTNATYYCDYAWFNNGTVPDRSLRFGCHVSDGLNAGLFSVDAYHAPAYAHWCYGGGLFLEQ